MRKITPLYCMVMSGIFFVSSPLSQLYIRTQVSTTTHFCIKKAIMVRNLIIKSFAESQKLMFNNNNNNNNKSSLSTSRDRDGVEMPLDEEKDQINTTTINDSDNDNDDNNDDDNDNDYFELEEDIFSLLFVSEVKSISMLFGWCVFILQVTILFLIYTDLMNDDKHRNTNYEQDDNPFNIPVHVDSMSVAVSQFLAIIIAVISQQDVLISIDALFAVKYDRHVVVVDAGLPHATLLRWRLYNTLRWIEGTMTLFVSLVIVVQTTNVLDIFLNFAAVEFVSNLDNVTYILATKGFLGHKIKSKTERVQHVRFQRDRSWKRVLLIQSVFCFNLFIMITVWISVRVRQEHGYYLQQEACHSITVEFSGEYQAVLPTRITKQGDGSSNMMTQRRPVYFERGKVGDPKAGQFYYCDNAKSWVFTIPALESVLNKKEDSTGVTCENGWLLMSPMTDAYKLEDVELNNWIIVAGSGIITTAKNLFLSCGECKRDSDCSFNGVCDISTGSCSCNPGWQGRVCNLQAPACKEMVWMNLGNSADKYQELAPYTLLTRDDGNPVHIYDRPVYQLIRNVPGLCDDDNITDTLIYTGRRWFDLWYCKEDQDMIENGDFHTYWSDAVEKSMMWYSEETDSELPTGFEWYEMGASRSRGNYGLYGYSNKIHARFECLDVGCNPDLNTGTCGIYGRCERTDESSNATHCICSEWASGHFCEYKRFDDYAANQMYMMEEIIFASDTYEDFYLEIMLNWTMNDEFYNRYWDYQMKTYFIEEATIDAPGMDTTRYPVIPGANVSNDIYNGGGSHR